MFAFLSRHRLQAALIAGLALTGCSTMRLPALMPAHETKQGSASLVLHPNLASSRLVQAIVSPYTAKSIARLEVVPYLETAPGVFKAIAAGTGKPTDSTDLSVILHAKMVAPSVDLSKPLRFENLRPNATYRVVARAFDEEGKPISTDAKSYVQLSVGMQGKPTAGTLPITLVDILFSGSTTLTLRHAEAGVRNYDHAIATLYTVLDDAEIPVPGGSRTLAYGLRPDTLKLTNLQPKTLYRVKVSIVKPGLPTLIAASVDIPVDHDDTPKPRTLEVSIPYSVTSLAGQAGQEGSTEGEGQAARFNLPFGLAADAAGNLYIADTWNRTIRKITPDGTVTTIAGNAGVSGSTDGDRNTAHFTNPWGITVDAAGNLYVSEANHTIRKITPGGTVTTIAGKAGESGDADGDRNTARLKAPRGLAVDAAGNLYVADMDNDTIRKITPEGDVTTLAGNSKIPGSTDGIGSVARFYRPEGLAMDTAGNLFVTDGHTSIIRKISPQGVVETIAGQAGESGHLDNPDGKKARFETPAAIARDTAGNLYVADRTNHTIRKVSPQGEVTTIAGKAGVMGSMDAPDGKDAGFDTPYGIAVDALGNVYVADTENHTIRKLQ